MSTPQESQGASPGEIREIREIRNERVPLARIVAHAENYQHHPPEQLKRIAASLVRFGQVRSIVVQAQGEPQEGGAYLLVAGHGLVEAARLVAQGRVSAPPLRRHELTALDARVLPASWPALKVKGYLVADNETVRSPLIRDYLTSYAAARPTSGASPVLATPEEAIQ